MSSLHDVLVARLENVRRNGDGTYQARCPACAALNNGDSQKVHLRIWASGAFRCAKAGSEDTDHNRAIRAFIHEGVDPLAIATLAATSLEDPNPKLDADTVYPEEMLQRLIPNHRYWIGRGIDEAVLRRLEGGLVPSDPPSKLSGRYTFPIRDYATRRIVGWTGRLTNDASFGPKHKHLVRVSRAIYPLTTVKDAIIRARKVVLNEGMGDQLALMTAGIDYTLMLMGLHINSRLLGYLVSANLDEVIISTNNDAIGKPESQCAGNVAAEKIRAKLVPYLGEHKVRVRLPQTRKDWCKTLEDGTNELAVFKGELESDSTLVAPTETVNPELFTL